MAREGGRTKDEFKVIIRRLPSKMTWEEVEEQLSPLPDHFYRQFSPAHPELFPHSYATCYLGIKGEKEVLDFANRFNRYVFIDSAGNESKAVVEFAQYQKFPKSSKDEIGGDSKIATIETDPLYLSFLEELEKEDKAHVTIEDQLKEAEEKEKIKLAGDEKVIVTPLVKYFFDQAKNKGHPDTMRRRNDRYVDTFPKTTRKIPFDRKEKDQRPEKNGYEKKYGGRPNSGGGRIMREEREKEEDTGKVDSLNPRVRDLLKNGGQKEDKDKKRPPRPRGNNEKPKDKGVRPERPIYNPGQRKKPEEKKES